MQRAIAYGTYGCGIMGKSECNYLPSTVNIYLGQFNVINLLFGPSSFITKGFGKHFRIKSSEIKTWTSATSPLSNTNYYVLGNVIYLKEMLWKVWVPYLWDAFYKEKESHSEHSKGLHSRETFYLNSSHSFVYPRLIYSNVFSHSIFFI